MTWQARALDGGSLEDESGSTLWAAAPCVFEASLGGRGLYGDRVAMADADKGAPPPDEVVSPPDEERSVIGHISS